MARLSIVLALALLLVIQVSRQLFEHDLTLSTIGTVQRESYLLQFRLLFCSV